MFTELKKWFTEEYVHEKDNKITQWYWRKKYNTVLGELELLKETMANEVYRAVLDKLGDPLTIKRLNEENKRLRTLLKAAREERNALFGLAPKSVYENIENLEKYKDRLEILKVNNVFNPFLVS